MQTKLTGNDVKWNKILALILAALFFAAAGGLAVISGSHSLTHTYNIGKVCDARTLGFTVNLNPNSSDNYFWASSGESPREWKYLYLDLDNANFTEEPFEIQSYNTEGPVGNSIRMNLKSGYNEIKLNGSECNAVQIKAIGDTSISFVAQIIELREQKLTFSMSKYLQYVAMIFSGFMILAVLIIALFRWKKWHIDWYAPIDFLQDVYISFGNHMLPLSRKVRPGVKKALRIAALICWMFWIMLMWNMGKYVLTAYFKYNVLLFCITMMLISVSMLEHKLVKVRWDNPLVYCWFWLSICMCISEFFVSKRFCMIGYVNLTVFGFYYFIIANCNAKNILKELILAFKIAFGISFIFTLLLRPRDPGVGLMGHAWNPNPYGNFCAIVLIGYLYSIRELILEKKINYKGILNVIGLIVTTSFVLLTGSRCAFIMMAIAYGILGVDFIGFIRKKVLLLHKAITMFIMWGVSLCVVHVFLSWATINLPIYCLVFPWDSCTEIQTTKPFIVLSMEIPIIQKVMFNEHISAIASGRNLYWMGFLREINILGHYYYPIMWGGARNPHNGILGIIYRYGVLAAVPYILMFANACIVNAKQYVKSRLTLSSNESFYLATGVICISVCMLLDVFESPFLATEWLWWYWCLGFGFICYNRQKSKKEALT